MIGCVITGGEAPSITGKPTNQKLIAGAEATLACAVTGQPTPDVHWTFLRKSAITLLTYLLTEFIVFFIFD